jgi:predicted RNase H-like HicB family nuclease
MKINAPLQSSTFSLTAILHWEEDVYVAECPEVGTASQGETIEEALVNLQEATELYIVEMDGEMDGSAPIGNSKFKINFGL